MSEEVDSLRQDENAECTVELHNSVSTIDSSNNVVIMHNFSDEEIDYDDSFIIMKDSDFHSESLNSSKESAKVHDIVNTISQKEEALEQASSNEDQILHCVLVEKEASCVCKNERLSIQSNSSVAFYSDVMNKPSSQTSDEFSMFYSSPNSSHQSICGHTPSSQTKVRRFGQRFDAGVLLDAMRESFSRISSGDSLRQQSEPSLLQNNDEVNPSLLRFESQPALNSSFELSSFETADTYVPIETQSKPEPQKKKPKELPPGENNPDAYLGANLCFDYLNTGICKRQVAGNVCHFRHLDACHPDVIANRFFNNTLTEEEIFEFNLRPCEANECNPFAQKNAKICFDFLNKKVCSRNAAMRICRYRHLLPNHPDAIADRNRRI